MAWVSLDRLDDDPAALIALLAHADARVDRAGVDWLSGTSADGMLLLGRVVLWLAGGLPRVLLHILRVDQDGRSSTELASPACHDVLGIVISKVPTGSQFVAVSRAQT